MNTILVIEDYPDNMALIEEILDDEGYAVLKAEAAELGIELLKEHSVDLVLMDISLPQMSGLEATRIIKSDSTLRHIPVIALTAHAMDSDRENAFSAGCDGFLTKPINEETLLYRIKETLQMAHA